MKFTWLETYLLREELGEGTVRDGKMKTLISAESDLQIKLSDHENKLSPWKTQLLGKLKFRN